MTGNSRTDCQVNSMIQNWLQEFSLALLRKQWGNCFLRHHFFNVMNERVKIRARHWMNGAVTHSSSIDLTELTRRDLPFFLIVWTGPRIVGLIVCQCKDTYFFSNRQLFLPFSLLIPILFVILHPMKRNYCRTL